jgi:hypothetical protein
MKVGTTETFVVATVLFDEKYTNFNLEKLAQAKRMIGCNQGNEFKWTSLSGIRLKQKRLDVLREICGGKFLLLLDAVSKRELIERGSEALQIPQQLFVHLFAIRAVGKHVGQGTYVDLHIDKLKRPADQVDIEQAMHFMDERTATSYGQFVKIKWVDSRTHKMIQIADFLAGAARLVIEDNLDVSVDCRSCRPKTPMCGYARSETVMKRAGYWRELYAKLPDAGPVSAVKGMTLIPSDGRRWRSFALYECGGRGKAWWKA